MRCLIKNIDVVDEPADALIYSTNVSLNCSGGVGSALLSRYGKVVQTDLHGLLTSSGRRFANQGEWFQHVSAGMPYQAVFHNVPCDGWYDTTPEKVEGVLRDCLKECLRLGGIGTIATSALATGYGHLSFDDYLRLAARVFADPAYGSFDRVTLCIADGPSYEEALKMIESEFLGIHPA